MNEPDMYPMDFSARDFNSSTDPLFYRRWSPRSFQKKEIDPQTLETIFDAARWSPSCYNDQPWIFLTSETEEDFQKFHSLLVTVNQKWAHNASVIGFILSRNRFTFNSKPNPWGPFDCGAAWMAMTLQARKLGLYTHGMAGVTFDKAYETLEINRDEYRLVCAFVIGWIDTPDQLPADFQEREKPSERKPVTDIWKKGSLTEG